MIETLYLEDGFLRPLSVDELSALHLGLGRFEDSSDLFLAPYLLDIPFVNHLAEKTSRLTRESSANDDWDSVWAIVNEEEIVGFLEFDAEPSASGCAMLRWTVSPDWLDSPMIPEALRRVVEWAFTDEACRSIRVDESFRPLGDMAPILRRLGFRRTGSADTGMRLDKVIEGRLL